MLYRYRGKRARDDEDDLDPQQSAQKYVWAQAAPETDWWHKYNLIQLDVREAKT